MPNTYVIGMPNKTIVPKNGVDKIRDIRIIRIAKLNNRMLCLGFSNPMIPVARRINGMNIHKESKETNRDVYGM